MSDLRSALAALDPKNDAQWTVDGAPLMEAVGPGFTRKQITTAFPHFSRSNPVLEAPPAVIETPAPPAETTKASVFGLESSEFGGVSDEDDEDDEPYVPPTPDQLAAAAQQEGDAMAILAAKKAQAAAAVKELDEATAAHDAVVAQQEATAPPAHLHQQSSLMYFLQSTQKQKPEKSVIDKVMERKDGYGRRRPVFFPQNDPSKK
jgi:hypothetical protein